MNKGGQYRGTQVLLTIGLLFLFYYMINFSPTALGQRTDQDLLLFRKSKEYREQTRLPEEKMVEVTQTGLINVNLYRVDITKALQRIAQVTDTVIAVDDRVRGEITLQMTQVGLEEVLETIVSGRAYRFRRIGDVYIVEPVPPLLPPPEPKLPVGERLINNVFIETGIREVLRTLAGQTDVNILADDTVEGYVTVRLEGVPLEKALEMVLAPGGYTWVKRDDYYLVGSAIPRNPIFQSLSQSRRIKLKYLSARSVSNLLSDFFDPYVKVDTERGTLLLTGPAEIIARLEGDIEKIDVPRKQIMIEALVTEITREKGTDFGIDWGWTWLPSAISQANQIQGVAVSGLEIGYTSKVVGEILASLEALVTRGQAEIKARPRVATLEGEEATINVDRVEYYVIATPEAEYGRFETITVGVSLSIKPRITEGNEIIMSIAPKTSDVIKRTAEELPVISRRSVETVVRVKDGQTIIIGGLLQTTERKLIKEVPYLSKIPLLGLLFKQESVSTQETELLVFITPKIID